MGLYMEVPDRKGKALQILALDDRVERIFKLPSFEEIPEGFFLVCVVDNGPFEAAGVVYNERELAAFTHRDNREREWLLVPEDVVHKYAPGARAYLGER